MPVGLGAHCLDHESLWKVPTLAYEHMRSIRASEAEGSFCGAVVYMNKFLYFITACRFCSIHASGICSEHQDISDSIPPNADPTDWIKCGAEEPPSTHSMAHASFEAGIWQVAEASATQGSALVVQNLQLVCTWHALLHYSDPSSIC